MCEGTGTTLLPTNFELPENITLVIVKPKVSVPTKAAYAGVTPCLPDTPIDTLVKSLPIEQWQGKIKNDFEASVFPEYPAISQIKEQLLDQGAIYASMSGSGSAVYGIFRKDDIVTEKLEPLFAGCDIFVNRQEK